jgi:hypothetical protein
MIKAMGTDALGKLYPEVRAIADRHDVWQGMYYDAPVDPLAEKRLDIAVSEIKEWLAAHRESLKE